MRLAESRNSQLSVLFPRTAVAAHLVDHARVQFKLGMRSAVAFLFLSGDECRLEGVLVGARAAHHGLDVGQPLGSHAQERLRQPLRPSCRRRVAQRRTVSQQRQVLGILRRIPRPAILPKR